MSERGRLAIWLALLLALIATGAWQWQRGIVVDSDILALLPESDRDPLLQRAVDHSADQAEGLVVWLVAAADRGAAVAGARWLEQRLADAPELRKVDMDRLAAEALRTHRHHLLPAGDRDLLHRDPAAWLAAKRAALFGPAGWQRAAMLAEDPLYLQGDYRLSLLPEGDFDSGYAVRCEAGGCHAAVVNQLAGQRFALADQRALLQRIAAVRAAAADRGLEVLAGGLPVFVAEATSQAQREVSIVGLGSTLGIVLLLLAVFRSAYPLLLALLALGFGMASAVLVCLLIFGRIHAVTLIFGASLVGVAIDYVLHWFGNRFRGEGVEPVGEPVLLRALGLALLTSTLGFGLLSLTPFPGLRQVAVFFVVGLSGAWLTVALALPALGRRLDLCWRPGLSLPDRLAWAWSRLGHRHWTWIVAGACVLLAGIARLQPVDDLRLMQSMPEERLADYQVMRTLAPFASDSQFYLVRGADSETVLAAEIELVKMLRQRPDAVRRVQALTDAFPSSQMQRRSQGDLQALCASGRLAAWLADLGAAEIAAAECARIGNTQPLPVAEWAAAIGPPWQGLWLGCSAGECASMVALSGVRDLSALADLAGAIEGVQWVDPVAQVSGVLGEYRRVASAWLLVALGLIAPLLIWRLGLGLGLRAALVPALTAASVLATLGWLGVSFSLFNLLALLVVGGISVDYAVFNAIGGRHPGTSLATVMAALTTLLAFGLLALSQTALVAAFGLTIALGIGYALIWAPLMVHRP